MSISSKTMKEFVVRAADVLPGKWVVVGGSVLHLLDSGVRQTEDIDLVGPPESGQSETLKLMDLAESFGLPIEAINQAAAFFLFKIPGWETKLISVHQGRLGEFFRPNIELYFELKLARHTEADIEDCLSYLDYTVTHAETFDLEKLELICNHKLKSPKEAQSLQRILAGIDKYK